MEEESPRRASAPTRVAFAALLTIVGVNVWTGGPLFALWVGSRVQGSGPPTMGAVFVVVVVLVFFFSASPIDNRTGRAALVPQNGQAETS